MCLNALISSGLTQSPPFNQQDSGQINMSNPHERVARSAQGLRKLQTAVLMETFCLISLINDTCKECKMLKDTKLQVIMCGGRKGLRQRE